MGYTFNNSAYNTTGVGDEDDNTDGGLLKEDLMLLGTFTTTGAQGIVFSEAALLDFINNDTNDTVTFILYQSTQSKNDRFFATKESGSDFAQLSVAVPEPQVFGLLAGLCGLAYVMLGRRGRSE